jgi:hypothetical protein
MMRITYKEQMGNLIDSMISEILSINKKVWHIEYANDLYLSFYDGYNDNYWNIFLVTVNEGEISVTYRDFRNEVNTMEFKEIPLYHMVEITDYIISL